MKYFFLNLTFLLVTLLSFVISKFNSKKKALYFIAFKKKKIIDQRSWLYCSETNLKNSLNFVRCFNLSCIIELFFKYKTIFVVNSLQYFFSDKFVKHFIKKTFVINQTKKFLTIDDYRYLDIFLPVCTTNKVTTYGYMHGRFSENLFYQESLKRNKFDNYYVWNNYFKKKILKMNKMYKKKNIIVLNNYKTHFKIKNLTNYKKKKNILFLQEDRIPHKYIHLIVDKLHKKKKEYNFYYKVRPNNKISQREKIYFQNKDINIFDKIELSKLIVEKKINFVFGFNSSFLYIASLNNLYPISIDNKYLLKDLKEDQIVFFLDLKKNLDQQFQNLLKSKKRLNFIKKKLWY
jgi:hypothetical protein